MRPLGTVTLSPGVGPPTSKITIEGTGFDAGEPVVLSFDDDTRRTVLADEEGGFATQRSVPHTAPPGEHLVSAIGRSSGRSAEATFLVRTNWPTFRFDNTRGGSNPYENVLNTRNVHGLALAWSQPIGQGNFFGENPSPAVSDGLVFAGSPEGLGAFDVETGATVWTSPLWVESAPTVVDGVVYVGGSDDLGYSVSALAADTGETLWRFGTGWVVRSSPAVEKGIVFVGSNDGYLYALDGATGQPVWAQRLTEKFFSVSTPAVVEDTLYVVGGPTVDALDISTGHPIWAASCGASFPSVVGPVVDGGVVYVGGDDFFNNDILCAFDAGTGEALWTTFLGTYSAGVAVDAEMIYAVTQDTVFALDKDTGIEIWKQDLGLFSEGPPSVANGVLYIPGFRDITALETRTGSVLWTTDFATHHEPATPAIVDGRLFAAVEDEDLYVFELP